MSALDETAAAPAFASPQDTLAPQTSPDGGGGRKPPFLLLAPPASASGGAPRKLWTRADYQRLFECRVLDGDEPVELLEGEIVVKVKKGRPHIVACMRCQRLLMQVFGMERIQSQAPVAPDNHNEMDPDVAVLRLTVDDYPGDAPGPSELLLLVDIPVATKRRDGYIKATVYARAGVPEYWVLDIKARTLTVLREPSQTGCQKERLLAEADVVAPLFAPEAALNVSAMLPPIVSETVARTTNSEGAAQ